MSVQASGGSDPPPGLGCLPEHLADHRWNIPMMGLHHGRDLGDALDDRAIPKIIGLVVDHERSRQNRRKLKEHFPFVMSFNRDGHARLSVVAEHAPPTL